MQTPSSHPRHRRSARQWRSAPSMLTQHAHPSRHGFESASEPWRARVVFSTQRVKERVEEFSSRVGIGMKTLAWALVGAAMAMTTTAVADGKDQAPFGLRYGMPKEAVAFDTLPEKFSVVVGYEPVAGQPKLKLMRNPMLTQCERAFDGMSLMFLFSEDWHDWILPKSGPVEDFEDYGALDEHEQSPTLEEWAASLKFTGPVLTSDLASSRYLHEKEDHERRLETLKKFTDREALIDAVVQKPSDLAFVSTEKFEKNWQQKLIAEVKSRHRTAAGYTFEVAGKKREICLVFGSEGLISIYIPQSEVADVWAGLVDSLRKDKKYRSFYAEQQDGEFTNELMRVLVHSAWIDDDRKVAIVAYVTGVKRKGLLASKNTAMTTIQRLRRS